MCVDALEEPITQRLLVVDDEDSVLKMVKTLLSRARYDVITCETATDALKMVKLEHFDCIITDAVMPGVSGYDLVKTIRKGNSPDIPILMLTRKRNRQDVKKAVEAGITDYVLKPIDEHLFLDKVEACIKKGGGKRHIVDCPVHGDLSKSQISLECRVTFISESYITLRLSTLLLPQSEFEMRSPLYQEIGINPPIIKLMDCKEIMGLTETRELPYEAKFSFIGVPEPDLRKIRNWINREEIRRRK